MSAPFTGDDRPIKSDPSYQSATEQLLLKMAREQTAARSARSCPRCGGELERDAAMRAVVCAEGWCNWRLTDEEACSQTFTNRGPSGAFTITLPKPPPMRVTFNGVDVLCGDYVRDTIIPEINRAVGADKIVPEAEFLGYTTRGLGESNDVRLDYAAEPPICEPKTAPTTKLDLSEFETYTTTLAGVLAETDAFTKMIFDAAYGPGLKFNESEVRPQPTPIVTPIESPTVARARDLLARNAELRAEIADARRDVRGWLARNAPKPKPGRVARVRVWLNGIGFAQGIVLGVAVIATFGAVGSLAESLPVLMEALR